MWVIFQRSKRDNRFLGLVQIGFETEAAAKLWIERDGDDQLRYEPSRMAVYSLADIDSLFPKEEGE